MNHCITMVRNGFGDCAGFAYDADYERVIRVSGDGREVIQITGVCQLVEIDDAVVAHRLADEFGTNESGSAGHEQRHQAFAFFRPFVFSTTGFSAASPAASSAAAAAGTP